MTQTTRRQLESLAQAAARTFQSGVAICPTSCSWSPIVVPESMEAITAPWWITTAD
ncbi:MAG: hypothetical protein KBF43_05155 [Dermatophilaceae bacterium]|nr:hypothetical protein [Actinomycetales bacterium]MBP8881691.1 hypothetical protein [Dermatophilaceae bacterium]MBP9917957.1 hypothetical protein [Dermatophilaceae bacterium]